MYRYTRLASVMLGVSMAFAFGCGQTSHEVWKDTKRYYREYLNPPATVDFEKQGFSTPEEQRLAQGFIGIDMQLRSLERGLDNAHRPDKEWVERFLKQYPWVAGAAAVNSTGEVMARMPAFDMKNINYTPLLEPDSKQRMRDLRSAVVETPLGPEIVVASPLYAAMDFKGLFAVHFDIRALLPYSSDPENIVIASPKGVLWPGRFDIGATPLAKVNWDAVLKDSTFGTLSNSHGEFFWVSRYVGNLPLVFAVPVEGQFPENLEQLSILSSARELGNAAKIAPPENMELPPALGEDDPSLLTIPAPELPPSSLEESSVQ